MTLVRLLPGIAFRAEPPTQVSLPRMDVSAFVGFAQCGPLHTPVVIESYGEFVDIFGGVVRLARDEVNAIDQTACLAPAVQAFFNQGGRRCWVVRVAAIATESETGQSMGAETSYFYPPGLLQIQPSGYRPVALAARSPGSWADALEAGVELLSTPLSFTAPTTTDLATLDISPPPQPLQVGDLLQFNGDRTTTNQQRGYAVIEVITPLANGHLRLSLGTSYWFQHVVLADLPNSLGTVTYQDRDVTGNLAGNILTAPLEVRAGDWVLFMTASLRAWLQVAQDGGDRLILNPLGWQEGFDLTTFNLAQVQLIRLGLRARQADGNFTLEDLACAAPQPRFLGYLPNDATLFNPRWGQPSLPSDDPSLGLRATVRSPRFPLAATATTPFIPLGVETAAIWRSPTYSDRLPLERDGLVPETEDPGGLTGLDWAEFWPRLYLDPSLRDVSQRSLLTTAQDRLYLQGRALRGIHALLPIAEISSVATPDAAHVGWQLTASEQQQEEPPTLGLFLYLLLVLDQAMEPRDFVTKDQLTPTQFIWRFFLMAEPVSAMVASSPETSSDWLLLPSLTYETAGLLTIQTATARLAAALGDRVAICGLPKHYLSAEVRLYQQQLLVQLQQSGNSTASYVALYHPWLINRDLSGNLRHSHPAGAVCGAIASRSRQRGAWVAPANEVLVDALGTTPILMETDEAILYQLGINPIRFQTAIATIWGAFTQSTVPELEDLNIRRLLILLKRIATNVGREHIFDVHNGALRRRVKRQFERVLGQLFQLGAFAGDVPVEAYQVSIDTTLNTATSVAQGRFIVELKVAPSQPLTFITVRLLQQAPEALLIQEVFR